MRKKGNEVMMPFFRNARHLFFKIKSYFIFLFVCVLIGFILPNLWVWHKGNKFIIASQPIAKREFAIVLGAGVHGLNLSGALRSRMTKAIELYKNHKIRHILVSGDGTEQFYNETLAMRRFAMQQNIPLEVLIEDPLGYSTYASIIRAKTIYDIKSAYIISQNFHLVRACWLADTQGISVEGVPTGGSMSDEWYYIIRETLARSKDFLMYLLDAEPPTLRGALF